MSFDTFTNNRWKLSVSDDLNEIVALPDTERMRAFVAQASKDLAEKIMYYEEELILREVSAEGLDRLIKLCQNELLRRKELK